MNDNPKVTPIRGGRPPISDIPAMLRQMADWIEKGEIKASSCLFIIPRREGDWPDIYCWGDHLGDLFITTLELAKHWLIVNAVKRRP